MRREKVTKRRVPSIGDKLVPVRRRARIVPERLTVLARGVVVLVVVYAELWTFRQAASRCEWDDNGGRDAVRVFVGADPQLIDYATSYPDRSAPLRWLTVAVTDLYARKSWRWAMRVNKPDAVVWLGDLLDAGRTLIKSERDYAKQANRFHSVFPLPRDSDKRTVPSIILPGNHDLSIYNGDGLEQFQRHFGTAAHHSIHSMAGWEIVAIDSVSLVAGSQDERDWITALPVHDKPRVLLTHVPLFRPDGTDCGPKRESRRSSIRQGKGYGYQNELSEQDSAWILRSIPNVRLILSGDDHDYCEVTHDTGNGQTVKETTLKAFSMAMGVRKPGYELVSLWTSGEFASVKQVTCTLPDQIGLWLHVYLPFALLTSAALVLPRLYRSATSSRSTMARSNGLPVAHKHKRSLSRQLLFSAASEIDREDDVLPLHQTRNGGAVDALEDDMIDPHVVAPFAYHYSNDSNGGYGYHAPVEPDGMPSPASPSSSSSKGRRPSRMWMWDRDGGDLEGGTPTTTAARRRSGLVLIPRRFVARAVRAVTRPVLSKIEGGVLFEATVEFARIAWPGVAVWIALAAYYLLS